MNGSATENSKQIIDTVKKLIDIQQKDDSSFLHLQRDINLIHDDKIKTLEQREMQSVLRQLQLIVSQLEEHRLHMMNDLKAQVENLQDGLEKIETQTQQLQARYDEIIDSRLKVIRTQQKALDAFRLSTLKARFKRFFQAWIGVLYQYEAKPLYIPKHYKKPIKLIDPPSICIVTPSFKQGEFIERTITSILDQNYPKLEFIIQDGGSTDQTVDIIKQYAHALKHWESKNDQGQSHAINLGFHHTTSEIMAYLNSDDILLPGTLSYVANYFAQHPEVDVVYGHRVIIDEYDLEVGRWVLPNHDSDVLLWADYIPQETLFWRRSMWDKVGGKIDESFKFAMDWDLLLRFREAGANFVRLPRFLGGFRVHSQQKTSTEINHTGVSEMQRLRKRCHGRYVANKEIVDNIFSYKLKSILLNKLYRWGILKY